VAAGLPCKVLILTTVDLDDYVYAGLRAGASGFLLKDTQPASLVAAIHTRRPPSGTGPAEKLACK
jgi:DNA-binding NarL/FixJ family response regulator